METKTIGTIAAVSVAATVGLTASLKSEVDISESKKEQVAVSPKSGKETTVIESFYAIGVIAGYSPMPFLKEDDSSGLSESDRVNAHIAKGIRCISRAYKGFSGGNGYDLTFFANTDEGSGWNKAFKTLDARMAISNSIESTSSTKVRAMTTAPDGCAVALGWLCYVPIEFSVSHSNTVQFSEIKTLNGCWLYR